MVLKPVVQVHTWGLCLFFKKISYNRHRVTDYGSGKGMFLRTFSSVELKSFYTKKLVSD